MNEQKLINSFRDWARFNDLDGGITLLEQTIVAQLIVCIAFEENAETPNLGLLQKLASAARITDQNLLNDMPSGNVF